MQLLIILALLLYGGKANAKNLIEEVKPVLETIGGDDMKQALKSAEEITEVLSAVQSMTAAGNANAEKTVPSGFVGEPCGAAAESSAAAPLSEEEGAMHSQPLAFPLAPISSIADRDITYSLSKYFSQC